MTTPITHLQAMEYYAAVAKILDQADPIQLGRLRDVLGLPDHTTTNLTTPAPEFVHSQVQAARMVAAAKGLSQATFRANMPWRLLQKKGLGEGVGFETRGPRSRRYTQEAVGYLIAHWDQTRMEMG